MILASSPCGWISRIITGLKDDLRSRVDLKSRSMITVMQLNTMISSFFLCRLLFWMNHSVPNIFGGFFCFLDYVRKRAFWIKNFHGVIFGLAQPRLDILQGENHQEDGINRQWWGGNNCRERGGCRSPRSSSARSLRLLSIRARR